MKKYAALRRQLFHFVLAIISLGSLADTVYPQWSNDSTVNNIVSASVNEENNVSIVEDGAGGAIVAWVQHMFELNIYAQRIDAFGVRRWNSNGVAICSAIGDQDEYIVVSDGAGGAFLAWRDFRDGASSDIYAQWINASGVIQWGPDGALVCDAVNNQSSVGIVRDGAGGVIISWLDLRSGTNNDIYAQRLNSSGTPQWTLNGVAIATLGVQISSSIVTDGTGGAIIVWMDVTVAGYDIYAQRVNGSGIKQWAANGDTVCAALRSQFLGGIISDGAGGVIIPWSDTRTSNGVHPDTADIYAQRLNGSGVAQWTADGTVICTAVHHQSLPVIVGDGATGAVIAWQDQRNAWADIYAQRIDATGARQWADGGDSNGVAISLQPGIGHFLGIVTDGAGGGIISWTDSRIVMDRNIHAQRVDSLGNVLWMPDGMSIGAAANNQNFPVIVSDGGEGAIMTWEDFRSGTNNDIYAQWVDGNGIRGGVSSLSISPSALAYGDVLVGQSLTDSVLATNTGSAPLVISSLFSTSPDFTVPSTADTLSSSESIRYNVTFAPLSAGEKNGRVVIHYSAPGAPDTVSVSGGGVISSFAVSRDSLYLGIVPVDSTRLDSVVVGNNGSAVLTITSVVSNDPELTVVPTSATIAASDSQKFYITFSPLTLYSGRTDTLTFIHNAAGSPSRVICTARNEMTIVDTVGEGWAMISLPLTVDNTTKSVLYPTAVSDAFAYTGSYSAAGTLEYGRGYWLKFSDGQSISITGSPRPADTITVVRGWNLIGSISVPVVVENITSIPGGLETSQFFGYDGVYQVASAIMPGDAYWVKADADGMLVLSSSNSLNASNRLAIVPGTELPPVPPVPSGDGQASSVFRNYALQQNYPNPFNPATHIAFDIPERSFVTLKVYNVSGHEVATLMTGTREAGRASVEWNASSLASAIYICRLEATSEANPGKTFTQVKKMVLIK